MSRINCSIQCLESLDQGGSADQSSNQSSVETGVFGFDSAEGSTPSVAPTVEAGPSPCPGSPGPSGWEIGNPPRCLSTVGSSLICAPPRLMKLRNYEITASASLAIPRQGFG